MASLLLSRACNAPTVRVSVLKQIPSKRIFKSYAGDRPTDTLSTSVRFLMEQAIELLTRKVYKISKGTLAVVGGLGIWFYKLNWPGDIETYITTGMPVGRSVNAVSETESDDLCKALFLIICIFYYIYFTVMDGSSF